MPRTSPHIASSRDRSSTPKPLPTAVCKYNATKPPRTMWCLNFTSPAAVGAPYRRIVPIISKEDTYLQLFLNHPHPPHPQTPPKPPLQLPHHTPIPTLRTSRIPNMRKQTRRQRELLLTSRTFEDIHSLPHPVADVTHQQHWSEGRDHILLPLIARCSDAMKVDEIDF